jgi:hypothetical protein
VKRTFVIIDEQSKFFATEAVKNLSYEKRMVVTIEPETRTLANNRAQWPVLNAIAEQVPWPVNGAMCKLTGEEFKQILTAAWRNETVRVAQGVDGGMVLLGHRTREFKREEWGEWMEYLNWFAAEKGVKIPISKSQAEQYGE